MGNDKKLNEDVRKSTVHTRPEPSTGRPERKPINTQDNKPTPDNSSTSNNNSPSNNNS